MTSKYSHATRQHENTYNCVIQIEDIGVHVFEALLADLTQNIKGLNLAWTAEEIKTDVQKLSAIISFGQDARLMIADLLQQGTCKYFRFGYQWNNSFHFTAIAARSSLLC